MPAPGTAHSRAIKDGRDPKVARVGFEEVSPVRTEHHIPGNHVQRLSSDPGRTARPLGVDDQKISGEHNVHVQTLEECSGRGRTG